jgi:hypothetical protein
MPSHFQVHKQGTDKHDCRTRCQAVKEQNITHDSKNMFRTCQDDLISFGNFFSSRSYENAPNTCQTCTKHAPNMRHICSKQAKYVRAPNKRQQARCTWRLVYHFARPFIACARAFNVHCAHVCVCASILRRTWPACKPCLQEIFRCDDRRIPPHTVYLHEQHAPHWQRLSGNALLPHHVLAAKRRCRRTDNPRWPVDGQSDAFRLCMLIIEPCQLWYQTALIAYMAR